MELRIALTVHSSDARIDINVRVNVDGLNRSETGSAARRIFAIRLFEFLPKLGGSAGGGTMGEVED